MTSAVFEGGLSYTPKAHPSIEMHFWTQSKRYEYQELCNHLTLNPVV